MKDVKAHVDLTTRKIYGCEPGTRKWFHEEGHLIFNDDPDKSFIIMLIEASDIMWKFTVMVSIIYNGLFGVAVILWSIPLFWILYEENWCNRYADRKYKEVGKK